MPRRNRQATAGPGSHRPPPETLRHGPDLQLWDIDQQDWNRPGAPAIVATVVGNARAGRVSLMDDGGGDRSQSVAALATILPTLTAKGYRFEALPGC